MEHPGSSVDKLREQVKEAEESGLFIGMLETENNAEAYPECQDEAQQGPSGSGTSYTTADPSTYDTESSDEENEEDKLGDRIERDGEQLDALIDHAQKRLNRSTPTSYRDLPPIRRATAIITVPLPGVPEEIIKQVQDAYDMTINTICHDRLAYRVTFRSSSVTQESKGTEVDDDLRHHVHQIEAERNSSSSPESKESDKDPMGILLKFTEGFKLRGRSNPEKGYTMKIAVNGITYDESIPLWSQLVKRNGVFTQYV